MDSKCQPMDIDAPDGSNNSEPVLRKNHLVLTRVAENESGQGLPYAPADWPIAGDFWGWKVGTRVNSSGFWQDRYLYLPTRLHKATQKRRFASKLSVKEYVQREFPDKDIDAFFNSFSWRIPAKGHTAAKGEATSSAKKSTEKVTEPSIESKIETVDCKVGNWMCRVQLQGRGYSLPAMPCDVCCSETGFCRDCCCILCCKSVNWAYGSYSFIRCEEKINENYICGHVAHVDCALRSYMAGTVGGNSGLDVEYYCRRCDNRSDLTVHITKLLVTCQSLDSGDEIEKILNVGLSLLHGSQQERCKRLLSRINLALAKLKSGYALEDIWRYENNPVLSAGQVTHSGSNGALCGTGDITINQNQTDCNTPWKFNNMQETQEPVISTHRIESLKLEEKIEKALLDLKESQGCEYKIAEERLMAQKDFVLGLFKQLEVEQTQLARNRSSSDCNVEALFANVMNRIRQIKRELLKLGEMKEVAKGFGRVPKVILKEHFGLQIAD